MRLLFSSTVSFSELANAQTAAEKSETKQSDKIDSAEIIDNFAQAFGGEMQLLSYETMKISMQATRGQTEFSWEVGYDDELIYSDTSNGSHLRVFSEQHAWTKTTGDWFLDKETTHERGIYAFPHYLTISRIANMVDQFEYRGIARVENPLTEDTRRAHLLVLPSQFGKDRHFLFDEETGLLVCHRNKFKDGKQNEYYYEFAPCEDLDGKLFLSREYINYAVGTQMTVVVNKVEVDVELKPELMSCPDAIKELIENPPADDEKSPDDG